MDALWQDLRYAAQQLRTHAGFTLVAVLTLALGIGANTAMFSVVNGVLLRPLPYREPDRLVSLEKVNYRGEFLQFRERAKTIDVAAYIGDKMSLTGYAEPVQLQGAATSANLFPLLGVNATIGRTFLPGESQPGHDNVVVLSNALWHARFGGDPKIVGQQIELDGVSRTVVGVMPPSVRFPNASTQLWVPLAIDPADRIRLWSTSVHIIGRLRAGVTLAQAGAEVGALAPQMRELIPWSMPADYFQGATAVPLRTQVVGNVQPMLLILLGAVGFVLLIACVNVANLLLVRTAARQRELAIRTALGAGRGRLVRQVLTESMLLGLMGGTAGLLLAAWGMHALTATLPADTPRLAEIGIDAKVLAVTLVVALVTGLAFGLLPAFRAARSNAHAVLKEGGRGSSAGAERRRLSGVLVASEVALAVVLVTGAGLLMRSFWQLLQVDPGFRTEQLVSATVAPPVQRYHDVASRRLFYQQLLERIDALPGVQSAAITSRLPFGGANYGAAFSIEGQPDPARTGDWPWADVYAVVSTGYLRAVGVPILRGRGFTDADRHGARRTVVINKQLAHEYWPGDDPIGKRIRLPGDTIGSIIVGIAADVKHDQLNETPKGTFYWPLTQWPAEEDMSVIVRTTTDPSAFAASLRSVVASVDANTPVSDIRTMNDLISTSLAQPRFAMALLAAFGALALILGAVGIYGVIAYTVNQRTHEIGVRMALGAHPGDVRRMVVRQGAVLAFAGVVVGLVASTLVTRLLTSLLYGVSAVDPVTFVAAPLLLMGIALLASYLPARRAARVDPIVALRAE